MKRITQLHKPKWINLFISFENTGSIQEASIENKLTYAYAMDIKRYLQEKEYIKVKLEGRSNKITFTTKGKELLRIIKELQAII